MRTLNRALSIALLLAGAVAAAQTWAAEGAEGGAKAEEEKAA